MNPYRFGRASRMKLDTCHPHLRILAMEALSLTPVDFAIVWGWRGEADQNLMVAQGLSRTPWPKSKHNNLSPNGDPESLALDFAPWVKGNIPWYDTHIFSLIAGVFFAASERVATPIDLRWGGDWNRDGSTRDQTLMDWGHLELVLPSDGGSMG